MGQMGRPGGGAVLMSPWGPPRVVRLTKFIPFSPLLPGNTRKGLAAGKRGQEGARQEEHGTGE